jgi:hypothetical protein
MIGAVAFGGAMIGFFLAYPKRVTRLPLMLMAPLWVLAWALTPLLPGNPSSRAPARRSPRSRWP